MLKLLSLDIDFVGSLSLVLDLLGESRGHVLKLILEHSNSLLGKFRLLLEVGVSVGQLVIQALLFKILLRKEAQLLLLSLSLSLDLVSLGIFLLK